MKKEIKRFETARNGSALIMTVVLTVLLAVVAVMFVAVARMDVASTSNISDNKTLDSAAKSIISIISKELVLDTPGVALKAGLLPKTSYPQYYDYYDYADVNDSWLASLQPYFHDNNSTPADTNDDIYCWHQISDVTGYLRQENFDCNRVPVGLTTIEDYPDITLNTDGSLQSQLADADGDGIADSKWIELENLRSSKGQRIYAAVRVIDNCGMVNINTAHSFDANTADGNSQMQINLRGLLKWADDINDLHDARCGSEDPNWNSFQNYVIWDFNVPDVNYLPFDISDELELRYRYCIDSKFRSRIENSLSDTLQLPYRPDSGHLYDTTGDWGHDDWGRRIVEPNDPCDTEADRRHLLTTYNFDRVINPNGGKMVNINDANAADLYRAIRQGLLDAGHPDANVAAQIAVNIKDYRDNDSNITDFNNPDDGRRYYGFEAQPFISEIATIIDATSPNGLAKNFYAVELYNPFNVSVNLNGFTLSRDMEGAPVGTDIPLSGIIGPNGCFVIVNKLGGFPTTPDATNLYLELSGNYVDEVPADGTFDRWDSYNLTLKRTVGPKEVILDFQPTDPGWFEPPSGYTPFYVQRDPNNWCIVYDTTVAASGSGTLGTKNSALIGGHNYNLYMKNDDFVTIGDIARPLKIGPNTVQAGTTPTDTIGQQLSSAAPLEPPVRMDLADPNYQQIFNYLTVFDPCNYGHPGSEMRVKGRINLNTAPAYVIAQLPWVSLRNDPIDYNDPNLAKAIVVYRDATQITGGGPDYRGRTPGIASIGQLNNVIDGTNSSYWIDYYKRAIAGDQMGFPDLDPNDGAANDFEERDLIFSRISNLVTVRSDVFTAYILVRVCTNVNGNKVEGPQKRYLAILDRTGVTSSSDRVKIISFHPVPGAR
jgi:hypothetical protein